MLFVSTASEAYENAIVQLPHHSATSWSSHWGQHRDEFDQRIQLLVHPPVAVPRAQPIISDDDDDDDEDEDEDEDEEDQAADDDEDDSSEDDDDYPAPASPSTPHKRRVGGVGKAVTNKDLRDMAEYVESVGAEFEQLRQRERWEPFHIQVWCFTIQWCYSLISRANIVLAPFMARMARSLAQIREGYVHIVFAT